VVVMAASGTLSPSKSSPHIPACILSRKSAILDRLIFEQPGIAQGIFSDLTDLKWPKILEFCTISPLMRRAVVDSRLKTAISWNIASMFPYARGHLHAASPI